MLETKAGTICTLSIELGEAKIHVVFFCLKNYAFNIACVTIESYHASGCSKLSAESHLGYKNSNEPSLHSILKISIACP
jgi:hypothetical protein